MAEIWGLLIDWVGNDYTQTIMKTAADYCDRRGISLAVFTIGRLSSTLESDTFHNHVLPLTDDPALDRLLICSAQMSREGGLALLERHFSEPRDIPIVCLGGPVNDYPVVTSDFRQVFYQLMNHLRIDHGYFRFAWLSGPPDNPDSRERSKLFLEYLTENNLQYNPELMLTGDFNRSSGRDAGKQLQAIKGRWDAVVAANDMMALGLRDALGPSAPVTGFDNDSVARESGITTIDLQLSAQVEKALDLLGKTGTVVPESQGKLIIRTSCGCTAKTEAAGPSARPNPEQSTERFGVLFENILVCQDMEELECVLNNALPSEGFDFWRLIPPREIGTKTQTNIPFIPNERELAAPFKLVAHSLFLESEIYGYLVLDLKNLDFVLSEWLRFNISLLLQSWHSKNKGIQVQKTLSLEIEKLLRRKKDIQSVVNSLPVWIIELDRNFNIRYFNQALENILGYSPERRQGGNFLGIVAQQDQDKIEDRLRHCLKTQSSTGCDFLFVTAKGQLVSVVAEINPLIEDGSLNLATLFGSLQFGGGLRLTGLNIKPLLDGVTQPEQALFRHFTFSKREKEVILLLTKGGDSADIAESLNISENTVRGYLHDIYIKTGVRKRKEFLELLGEYQMNSTNPHSLTQTLLARLISQL